MASQSFELVAQACPTPHECSKGLAYKTLVRRGDPSTLYELRRDKHACATGNTLTQTFHR